MFNVRLYHKCNDVPKRDSLECLEKYGNLIKWRADDSAIDLGSGDGSVTIILKKFMHCNFKKLVGSDISEAMVQFANEQHGDERTMFTVLDMEGDLPEELRSSFDHVFSFFAIHWINNQESVFANISELLKEGGDCLLAFLGTTHVYDIWRTLSRQIKWQPWLGNVEFYVSPYHDSENPEEQVKRIMLKKGFKNIEVNCINKTYIYDLKLFKNTMEAISPFKIPSDLRDEFMEDFMQVVCDLKMIEENINNVDEPVVRVTYSLLVAYGNK